MAIASVLLGGAAELCAEHGYHRDLSPVARLPGISRRRHLLLAVLHPFGCSVRTSVKVRHCIPDAVVSSYSNTGENPWIEVRP